MLSPPFSLVVSFGQERQAEFKISRGIAATYRRARERRGGWTDDDGQGGDEKHGTTEYVRQLRREEDSRSHRRRIANFIRCMKATFLPPSSSSR